MDSLLLRTGGSHSITKIAHTRNAYRAGDNSTMSPGEGTLIFYKADVPFKPNRLVIYNRYMVAGEWSPDCTYDKDKIEYVGEGETYYEFRVYVTNRDLFGNPDLHTRITAYVVE